MKERNKRTAELFWMSISQIVSEGLQMLGLGSALEAFEEDQGSLSCHTCCGTGPHFSPFNPKDRPIHSPHTTRKGVWRTYSNPDPHGSTSSILVLQTRGCGGPILTRILTGLHTVTSYDTQGDVEDLFLPGSSRVHIQYPRTTDKGIWGIYPYPDPHGSPSSHVVWHTRGCGGPILTRILTDTQSRNMLKMISKLLLDWEIKNIWSSFLCI
jgi:hypothetical protein